MQLSSSQQSITHCPSFLYPVQQKPHVNFDKGYPMSCSKPHHNVVMAMVYLPKRVLRRKSQFGNKEWERSVLGCKCFCCIGTTCVIGHEREWGQGRKQMNVIFPPESLLNQGSGAKDVLANPTRTEKIDSSNPMCNEKHFSLEVIHWPYPPLQ